MAKNEARIKFLADTEQFREQLKHANSSLTELRSEMKLSETQFKDNAHSVEALTDKKRILQQQLEASESKVKALRNTLEKAKQIYGENSIEVSKLQTQLNNAERQYKQLEAEVEDTNKELNEQDTHAKRAREALEDLASSTDKANDGFTVMKGVVADLVHDGLQLLVDGLKEISKFVMETGMDFESGMSEVKAISGATADEMEDLTEKAKQMGAETKFSAGESADAFKYMAMAGWDAEEMLNGIEGVMSLAAAANADLATASDIVTDALTAMGYAADDAGRLSDVMAAAAANANTNVEMMGETFKYAAPVAGTLGYSMEDVAIVTGLMANSGIKASQAGTTMRTAFTNLISPAKTAAETMQALGFYTEETITTFDQQSIDSQMLKVERASLAVKKAQDAYNDALKEYGEDSNEAAVKAAELAIKKEDLRIKSEKLEAQQKGEVKTIYGYNQAVQNEDGSMKSLRETLVYLRGAFANMTEAEQASAASAIFGKRAMSGMLAVINASDEDFDKLTAAIDGSEGAAKEMAETMQDNLAGDVEKLGGALETCGLQAYEGFSKPMREAVQSVTETMDSYDVAKLINGISYEIGGLANKAAGELPNALNGIVNFISAIVDHIDDIVVGIKTFVTTWAILKGLSIGMAIANIISKVAALVSGLATGTITLGGVTAALGGVQAALAGATMGISLIVAGIATAVSWLSNMKTKTEEYSEAAAANAHVLTEFEWGLKNLQPTLAGTNGLLSDSGKTMQQLDTAISETETAITTILSTALSEQRQLRENELLEIEQYNQRMAELQNEKLQVYRDQQNAVLLQVKNEGEALTQEAAAQHIVNMQEAMNQSNTIAQEAYQRRLIEIDNFHKAQGTIDSEAYRKDMEDAKANYDAQIAENATYNQQMLAQIAESAASWMSTEKEKWASILEDSGNSKKKYAKNLSEMDMENSKAFLQMYTTAKREGANISDETEQIAKDMLAAFDDLPKGMDEAGKDALLGLIDGMEGEIDGLENASEMTADEIVDTLESELDINSPSEVTAKIGGHVAEGLAVGMERKQGPLGTRISNFASGLIGKIKNAFGVHSPSKLTAEIGGFLSEGLGKGIADNEDAALAPMQGIVDKITGVDLSGSSSLSYDLSTQLGDMVSSALGGNAFSDLARMIEDLASRPISIKIGDREIIKATASANDSYSGMRNTFKNRGLAVE